VTRIDGETIILDSGRAVTLEELETLADELPWRTPRVIIMPPHEYVVESKLETPEQRETFEAMRFGCSMPFMVRLNVPPVKCVRH
jgi:hypothetical protein